MLDIVKQLFENNVISEETKSEIESAWETRIQENREQVTTALREEFAEKYEHDKSAMVEAVEAMLADRLQAELGELAEDRQGLIEARAKYAKKMKDDSKAMESFIFNNLNKELTALNSRRFNYETSSKDLKNNIDYLERFLLEGKPENPEETKKNIELKKKDLVIIHNEIKNH